MTKKSKKSAPKRLVDQLERAVEHQSADLYGRPEDFVRPLLQEMQIELMAPEIDITTKEGAQAALEKLQMTSNKLDFYQNRVQKLKNILLQKRMDID